MYKYILCTWHLKYIKKVLLISYQSRDLPDTDRLHERDSINANEIVHFLKIVTKTKTFITSHLGSKVWHIKMKSRV